MSKQTDWPEIVSADGLNELARRRGWAVLCDATCSFKSESLNSLHALWLSKAEPGDIPQRSEITARLLKPYLKILTLHERVTYPDGSRHYRVRLMGEASTHVAGDTLGKFYDEFLPDASVPLWNAMGDATLGHGAPLRMLIRADELDKSYLVGETLNAPLLASDGSASLVLSAGLFNGSLRWEDVVAQWRRQNAQMLAVD